MSTGIHSITLERIRQIEEEGWDDENDDQHTDGSLVAAAIAYAMPNVSPDRVSLPRHVFWPLSWDPKWFKPKNRRADLVRAGALIAAEIDRLDREVSALSVDDGHDDAM